MLMPLTGLPALLGGSQLVEVVENLVVSKVEIQPLGCISGPTSQNKPFNTGFIILAQLCLLSEIKD